MKFCINNLIMATLVSIIFISCQPLEEITYIPRKESFFGIDFRKYSEKEFLITPEKYLFDYESIGLITYTYLPAAEYKVIGVRKNPAYNARDPKASSQYEPVKMWEFEKVEINQVMDSVYDISQQLGADALVNFKIELKEESHGFGKKNPTSVIGYTISGFAIKRK